MNLVQSTVTRFGSITTRPKLICTANEVRSVTANLDKIEQFLSNALGFLEQVGLYDKAYELLEAIEEIIIATEETDANDGSRI